jgi:hypothetical protein
MDERYIGDGPNFDDEYAQLGWHLSNMDEEDMYKFEENAEMILQASASINQGKIIVEIPYDSHYSAIFKMFFCVFGQDGLTIANNLSCEILLTISSSDYKNQVKVRRIVHGTMENLVIEDNFEVKRNENDAFNAKITYLLNNGMLGLMSSQSATLGTALDIHVFLNQIFGTAEPVGIIEIGTERTEFPLRK